MKLLKENLQNKTTSSSGWNDAWFYPRRWSLIVMFSSCKWNNRFCLFGCWLHWVITLNNMVSSVRVRKWIRAEVLHLAETDGLLLHAGSGPKVTTSSRPHPGQTCQRSLGWQNQHLWNYFSTTELIDKSLRFTLTDPDVCFVNNRLFDKLHQRLVWVIF